MSYSQTEGAAKFAVLCLDELRVALPLGSVRRVVRAAAISPLPHAPEIVLGIVNVGGGIMPVVSLRRRFRLPERDIVLSDQFIIARTRQRAVALVVDTVAGVFEYAAKDIADVDTILPGMDYVDGVVRLADGLILVHDLDQCLSLEEAESLERALQPEAGT